MSHAVIAVEIVSVLDVGSTKSIFVAVVPAPKRKYTVGSLSAVPECVMSSVKLAIFASNVLAWLVAG
jgi:hypothetical protein